MMTATQEQLAALAALVGAQTCNRADAFPALDTAAGDDVFLAPTMRWLHLSFDAVSFAWVQEELICLLTRKDKDKFVGGPCVGFTRVVPLLRACQAAGVPEIVEIFGRGDHDAR